MKINFFDYKNETSKKSGTVFEILTLCFIMATLAVLLILTNFKEPENHKTEEYVSVFKETPFYEFLGFNTVENSQNASEKSKDGNAGSTEDYKEKKKEKLIKEYIKSGGCVDVFDHFADEILKKEV